MLEQGVQLQPQVFALHPQFGMMHQKFFYCHFVVWIEMLENEKFACTLIDDAEVS